MPDGTPTDLRIDPNTGLPAPQQTITILQGNGILPTGYGPMTAGSSLPYSCERIFPTIPPQHHTFQQGFEINDDFTVTPVPGNAYRFLFRPKFTGKFIVSGAASAWCATASRAAIVAASLRENVTAGPWNQFGGTEILEAQWELFFNPANTHEALVGPLPIFSNAFIATLRYDRWYNVNLTITGDGSARFNDGDFATLNLLELR